MKSTKAKQISFLVDIRVEHMEKVIEMGRRKEEVDPYFIPDPKVKQQLLNALKPFQK